MCHNDALTEVNGRTLRALTAMESWTLTKAMGTSKVYLPTVMIEISITGMSGTGCRASVTCCTSCVQLLTGVAHHGDYCLQILDCMWVLQLFTAGT
jgi:hypothetical protein